MIVSTYLLVLLPFCLQGKPPKAAPDPAVEHRYQELERFVEQAKGADSKLALAATEELARALDERLSIRTRAAKHLGTVPHVDVAVPALVAALKAAKKQAEEVLGEPRSTISQRPAPRSWNTETVRTSRPCCI